jgi:hypothetical protein
MSSGVGRKRKTYLWDPQAEVPSRTRRRYRQSTPDPTVSSSSSCDVGDYDLSHIDEVTNVSANVMISGSDAFLTFLSQEKQISSWLHHLWQMFILL